jgi:hypothetical protein
MSNEPQLQELIALYAMISRMRVRCLPRTFVYREDHGRSDRRLRRAEQDILKLNITSGAGIDPLKDFAEAARNELRTFSSL